MTEIRALEERAKELRCLYAVDAVLADRGQTPAGAFSRVLAEIPAGWQHPERTGAQITYLGRPYVGPGFCHEGATLSEPILLWDTRVGEIAVGLRGASSGDRKAFLPEEAELLRRIAGRLSEYLEWKHTELLGERTAGTRNHWAWRQRYADALADGLDPERFGVEAIYLFGSTARGDAGPGSDIDLLVVFGGSEPQREALESWLDGWSACLGEVALQQTGHPFPGGILNVEISAQPPDPRRLSELVELRLRRNAPHAPLA